MIARPVARGRLGRLAADERVRDAALALVAFALTLAVLRHRGTSRQLDAIGVVLAAVACLPLYARRRSPLAVFVLTTAASAMLNARGYASGPPFGPTIALFFVAGDERTRSQIGRTGAIVLALFAVHIGATTIPGHGFPTTPVLAGVLVWGGAWTLGDYLRQRRRRVAERVEHSARAARDELRERRLAVAEERTRIARDLHDSAAHAINVILVQAGAARLWQQRDPEAARRAIATIEDVARETIGEIDQLVRGLRENDLGGVEPPTGLAALGTLVERHRSAGLAIDLHTAGVPRPLARGLDQAAYRILQESLTNAARHGTGSASVEIVYGDDRLELAIANPASGPHGGETPTGGHGILGMRERAALLGGSLDATASGDRFHVRALLPLHGDERA